MKRVSVPKIIIGIVVFFALIQIIRPARTNPPVIPSRSLQAHVDVPPDVLSVMKRSCYDCHSNSTVWPWYSNVAPVSWYVIRDVNVGRSHINLQDWEAQINEQEAKEHLGLVCKMVREGRMPPADYRTIHTGTEVTPAETASICAWAQKVGTMEDDDKDKKDDK
jgi:hypothetical protein